MSHGPLTLVLQPFGGLKAKKGHLWAMFQLCSKFRRAFEQAGIQFIDDDETGGFGVRMAKKKRKR